MLIEMNNDDSKMPIGISDSDTLMNGNAFPWFREGYERYEPDTASVKLISENAASLHFIVFAGTWCGDTRKLLPEFYKVMDSAGVEDKQITLYLVGRDKKTQYGSSDIYEITNVPTFIVLKKGKQLGRVVEIVKTSIEIEMAVILEDKN